MQTPFKYAARKSEEEKEAAASSIDESQSDRPKPYADRVACLIFYRGAGELCGVGRLFARLQIAVLTPDRSLFANGAT